MQKRHNFFPFVNWPSFLELKSGLVSCRKLDFMAYRRAMRQRQLMEVINRKDSIKIVGRKIEKPGQHLIQKLSLILCAG